MWTITDKGLERGSLWVALLQFIGISPETRFSVNVNYGESIESMLSMAHLEARGWGGRYGFQCDHKDPAQRRVAIELIPLKTTMWNRDVRFQLGKKGLRPADPHELLALAIQHPVLKFQDCDIVSLDEAGHHHHNDDCCYMGESDTWASLSVERGKVIPDLYGGSGSVGSYIYPGALIAVREAN